LAIGEEELSEAVLFVVGSLPNEVVAVFVVILAVAVALVAEPVTFVLVLVLVNHGALTLPLSICDFS